MISSYKLSHKYYKVTTQKLLKMEEVCISAMIPSKLIKTMKEIDKDKITGTTAGFITAVDASDPAILNCFLSWLAEKEEDVIDPVAVPQFNPTIGNPPAVSMGVINEVRNVLAVYQALPATAPAPVIPPAPLPVPVVGYQFHHCRRSILTVIQKLKFGGAGLPNINDVPIGNFVADIRWSFANAVILTRSDT